MSTQGFKLDLLRIERIKAQVERGEEISAEDIAYIRETFEAIVEAFQPLLDAVRKSAMSLADLIAASKAQAAASDSVIDKSKAAEQRAALYEPLVAAVSRRGVNNMADVVRRAGRERRQ